MPLHLLAIESSCDETAAALFADNQLLSECIASQGIHASYGGVVPELASRAHQDNIIPVIESVYRKANLPITNTDYIAFTQGPGLMGALLVGNAFTSGLSLALNIPRIPVHHIKAHLFANFITPPYPKFPFLGLVVSGGHTQLLWVENYEKIDLLGQTQDDAIGEAFDKIAKLLGFPYPGGAHIDKHAKQGNPRAFPFPITRMPNLDFSFSGIKTAVLYFLRKQEKINPNFITQHLADLCASVQYTLVTMITEKVQAAIDKTKAQQLVIGGGVAANSALRIQLKNIAEKSHCTLFIPPPNHCQDNAAMIGITAYYRLLNGYKAAPNASLQPMARMPL